MTTPVNFEIAKLLKEKDEKFDVTSTLDYPTIAEVVMWLYEKHGIWISVICDCGNDNLFYSKIFSTEIGIERCIWTIKDKNSPTEAYEAAIEYVLKNLL